MLDINLDLKIRFPQPLMCWFFLKKKFTFFPLFIYFLHLAKSYDIIRDFQALILKKI